MEVQIETKETHRVQQTRRKMSKEERAEKRRNDHIAREKDRERKRAKRKNVAYRQIEQERDRERKKMLRSDTTFRTLEKIRDRMRKERKKLGLDNLDSKSGNARALPNTTNTIENSSRAPLKTETTVAETLLEPEVILSSEEVPVDENLLVPEVILSTNDYIQPPQNPYIHHHPHSHLHPQHNPHHHPQLPQPFSNNFTYGGQPPQNQF